MIEAVTNKGTFPDGYEPKTPWGKKLGRPLRIFGTPWHVAHQYELLKLPETEWFFIINHTRYWGKVARPEPENLFWVSHYDPGHYDMAVLHVDQQCVYEPIGKGRLFRELNGVVNDIPKVVICHGTPFWPEMYPSTEIVTKMEAMLEGLKETCVMNSKKAVEQWGFGHHITHGMDVTEWYDLPKENRIITSLSPAGLDAYYNRQLLQAVSEKLRGDHNIKHCHIGIDVKPGSFEEYKRFIGSSLIYFNPTLESPMPRSRTEAFLSGACVVTTQNHDIDQYFKDGENVFFVKNNPQSCVDKLVELFNDYETCIRIGQAGKKVAQQHFNSENFQKQWTDHIKNILCL